MILTGEALPPRPLLTARHSGRIYLSFQCPRTDLLHKVSRAFSTLFWSRGFLESNCKAFIFFCQVENFCRDKTEASHKTFKSIIFKASKNVEFHAFFSESLTIERHIRVLLLCHVPDKHNHWSTAQRYYCSTVM